MDIVFRNMVVLYLRLNQTVHQEVSEVTLTPTEILTVINDAGQDGISTPELADHFQISQPGMWNRLTELANDGLIEKHSLGSLQVDHWRITERGKESLEAQ